MLSGKRRQFGKGEFNMLKLMHLADLHLDYQQYGIKEREEDAYKAFEAAIKYAISEQVDVILVAGDFFHSKDIRARAWLRVRGLLEMLKDARIQVIMVEGNHDRALFGQDQTWVETLQAEGLATVLGSSGMPEDVVLDGVRVIGIPYLGHKEVEGLRQVKERLLGLTEMPTILLCHIGVSEVMGDLVPGMSVADLKTWLHPTIQYVATGHFHRPWSWGIVHCPGTINPCKVDEIYGGHYVFNADRSRVHSNVCYVPIEDYHQVRPIVRQDALDLDEVTFLSKQWEGAIVQLKYRGSESQGMIRSALKSNPLKLIVSYQAVIDEEGHKHYQASNTQELEMMLLDEILGDEAAIAVQLMNYALDGQNAKTMVDFVKEKVGIINAD